MARRHGHRSSPSRLVNVTRIETRRVVGNDGRARVWCTDRKRSFSIPWEDTLNSKDMHRKAARIHVGLKHDVRSIQSTERGFIFRKILKKGK